MRRRVLLWSAVDVKSFLGPSEITDLEAALGQFILYEKALRRQEVGCTWDSE